ncbi:MAG: uroporphyrinogen decarboxylase family protein [Candidatus Eiseniibacteriota bacterium]
MTSPLSRRDRVLAALRGDPVDRPPMSFWGHFYDREHSAEALAHATVEARARHDWDFVKLNPRASYHTEPWGVAFERSTDPLRKPVRLSHPIHDVRDYASIRPLPGNTGALGEQLEAIRLTRKLLPADVLLVETVFSPLAVVADLAKDPKSVEQHLKEDPAAVRGAVEAVTRTFEDFVPQALAAGADGIYFATVEWATRDRGWSPADYRAYASPFDLRVLARAHGSPMNVLHVCRPRNFLPALTDYPVAAFSWSATEDGNLNLREGLERIRGAAIGGIGHEDALLASTDAPALAQLDAGFAQTGGRRWIVAPGCSIDPHTPPERLEALREAVMSRA